MVVRFFFTFYKQNNYKNVKKSGRPRFTECCHWIHLPLGPKTKNDILLNFAFGTMSKTVWGISSDIFKDFLKNRENCPRNYHKNFSTNSIFRKQKILLTTNIVRLKSGHYASDTGRWKTLGVPVVIGGDSLPSPGWNRVNWSAKYWPVAPLATPVPASLRIVTCSTK